MIKKLKVEDIVKIMYLEDNDFNRLFECELGEWVQFLNQRVDEDEFFIYGVFKDDDLIGYLVAYFVKLPICKGVSVLYAKTAGLKHNKEMMEHLKEWAKEKKAKSIDIITTNVIGHGVYGFKKKATMMTIKL